MLADESDNEINISWLIKKNTFWRNCTLYFCVRNSRKTGSSHWMNSINSVHLCTRRETTRCPSVCQKRDSSESAFFTSCPRAAWLVLSGASAGGFALFFLCFHSGFSTLVISGVLRCLLTFLGPSSVCERDVQEEPQQVSQSSAEGRLSHVTGQHDCGTLTA